MTSYSFSDPSTTLVGSALDASNTGGNGAVKPAGSSVYDGSRVYRRDSVMAGTHHSVDYQLHQSSHTMDGKGLNGGNHIAGVSSSSSSFTDALAGINTSSVNDNTFADYFFKQQVMSLNSSHSDTSGHASPQQYHRQQIHDTHNSSDISSVVAAVAAATNSNTGTGRHGSSGDYSVYHNGSTTLQGHSHRQNSYSATHHYHQGMSSSHQSPSAAAAMLPGSVNMSPTTAASFSSSATTPSSVAIAHNTSTACLVDPLPSFLSTLPLQNSVESSKHSTTETAGAAANNSHMGSGNNNNSVGGNDYNKENHGGGGNSILAAAAAAAAAAVVSTGGDSGSGVGINVIPSSSASNTDMASLASGTNPYYNSSELNHANSAATSSFNSGVVNSQSSLGHGYYNQTRGSHSYDQPQQPGHSAYNVNGFAFSHNSSPATAATGGTTTSPLAAAPPSLSTQNTTAGAGMSAESGMSTSSSAAAVAAAAVAAVALGGGGSGSSATNPLDLNSYSISAFSRPLSRSSGTTTTMFLNNTNGSGNDPTGVPANTASSGLASSFTSDVGQSTGVMSPPHQLHSHYQYYQQPQQQQQRSYGDYSTYYRSSSNALAMGTTTGSTTGTGASPMSGTGIGTASGTTAGAHVSSSGAPQLSAAAAAAAAAAMGSGYYASAYQPYMRAGAGTGAHSYYYSQAPGRYIPYGAYPPIRHFVSPARPFKCETCEQSFSRNHDLKRHVKIHSGIKPHKCHKCGKSFGRSDALKRHSMVKRCRSTTSAAASSSTSAKSMPTQTSGASGMSMASQRQNKPQASVQLSHQLRDIPPQQHQQSSGGSSLMTSLAGNSRLAPVGSMFGQPGSSTMATSAGSIVSSMLASRTNSI
ncbi:hypothetical protein LPJ73_000017 [Coemansia sp. RSA 2703]|nr:hypothetical protein LPJ73_000017 [Coemansia sp. RSA 2703]KAJ2378294.1 hypothetical protein IW150_000889 [Coemansia sp. RSA 2607]KAJ2398526.1 hypothetical protein GGI05_000016 [Coemansia sp. RSA 2603]